MRTSFLMLLLSARAFAGEPVGAAGGQARQSASNPDAPVPEKGETVVVGERVWGDAERVGPYQQPRWTDRRRFPTTRVYVAPPGTFTFEFWLDTKVPLDGATARWRSTYEFTLALPWHLQLDLYLRTEQRGADPLFLESERIELRWALADWGVIPTNPTLYLEWIRPTNGPMKGEVKVLLGDAFTERLYWGLNVFYERELYGDKQQQEYGVTGGLSYSLLENTLGVGAEFRAEFVDVRASRPAPVEMEFLAGPSLSWRPLRQANVLLVWLVGMGLERPDSSSGFSARGVMLPTVIAGWRF
jgi:hypothetical protein